MRREMNDLMAKRAGMLADAEAAYKSGDHDAYTAKMTAIGNINSEINEVKALIDEQDRQFLAKAPDAKEEAEKAAERGNALMKGGEVKFSTIEVRKAITLAMAAWGSSRALSGKTCASIRLSSIPRLRLRCRARSTSPRASRLPSPEVS